MKPIHIWFADSQSFEIGFSLLFLEYPKGKVGNGENSQEVSKESFEIAIDRSFYNMLARGCVGFIIHVILHGASQHKKKINKGQNEISQLTRWRNDEK